MAMHLGRAIENMYDEFYTKMQRAGYNRDTGYKALADYQETELADGWREWWDEGDD